MIHIDDTSRIAKNTMFLNISTIATNLLSFILLVTLARYLDKGEFGQYTFAIYFTELFTILTDLGLSKIVVRELARDKALTVRYLSAAIVIKSLLGVVTFLLIFAVVNVINYTQAVKTIVYILGMYIILKSFGIYFVSIFMAHERMGLVALLNFLLKLTILICIGIIVFAGISLMKVAFAYLVGGLVYLILSFALIIKRLAKPKLEIDLSFYKTLIRESLPFAFFALFLNIGFNIDITFLKSISGDIATAYYGAGLALTGVFLFIPANLTSALFPVFSRFHRTSPRALTKYYEKSFQLLLILALPLAMGINILSEKIILLIYGQQYLPAALSLDILAWATVLIFLNSLEMILLPTTDRQGIATRVMFWGMIFNIILNLILIPRFSYVGASISKLITVLFIFVVNFVIISNKILRLNLIKIVPRPALATLLMGGFIYLFKGINLFLLVCFGSVLYFTTLILMRTFTISDLVLLKKFLNVPKTK